MMTNDRTQYVDFQAGIRIAYKRLSRKYGDQAGFDFMANAGEFRTKGIGCKVCGEPRIGILGLCATCEEWANALDCIWAN